MTLKPLLVLNPAKLTPAEIYALQCDGYQIQGHPYPGYAYDPETGRGIRFATAITSVSDQGSHPKTS